MYDSGNTWTGSVTFGAGSDDPPPNNVEMVLPSSKPEKKRRKVKGQSSEGNSTLYCKSTVFSEYCYIFRTEGYRDMSAKPTCQCRFFFLLFLDSFKHSLHLWMKT